MTGLDARHRVWDVLNKMADCVRQGLSEQAAAVGQQHKPPLGVCLQHILQAEVLADHSYSTVTRGSWEGRPVAVKRVKIGTSQDLESFRKEVQIIATLDHPGIVHLYGARVLPPDYSIILELGKQQLAERIHRDGWQPSGHEAMCAARQLAAAMCHLHDKGVLHRDINPSNVLFGEDGTVKLVDFSIAQFADELQADQADRGNLVKGGKPTGGFHKRHMVGTLQYLAPEVLQKEPTTCASDVYAWAITVNELLTGVFPFSDASKDDPRAQTILEFGYSRMELAAAVAAQGLRPTQSSTAPPELNDLIRRCWQEDPTKRPSAQQIEDEVADLAFDFSRHDAPANRSAAKTMLAAHGASQSAKHPPDGKDLPDTDTLAGGRHHEADDGAVFGVASHNLHTCRSAPEPKDASSDLNGRPEHEGEDLGPLQVRSGGSASVGPRDSMEDRHLIVSPVDEHLPETHLFGVFDGHRGSEAAAFLEAHLADALWQHRGRSAPAALKAAFLDVDRAFKQEQDGDASMTRKCKGRSPAQRRYPGSTAIAALLHGRHLHVANAGDCRAVLCRAGRAERVSRDHNAVDEEERARVTAVGASAMEVNGTWRIGPPGLQVTRSIGDHDLKPVGVVAEPEVHSLFVGQEEQFLILASDGLWECVSDERAVTYVQDTVKHPEMAAQRLISEVFIHGGGDNVTAVVIFLQPGSTLEQIYAEDS